LTLVRASQSTASTAILGRHSGGKLRYGSLMSKNVALIAARVAMNLSQEEMARTVTVDRRTYQRWEADDSVRPQAAQLRKLRDAAGLPIERLGFPPDKSILVVEDGRGGHDLEVRLPPVSAPARPPAGDYSGIWVSRYEYYSSSRDDTFTGLHHVVLEQDGSRASVRSLRNSARSTMSMDLTVAGNVLTGQWVEDTDKTGYYRGVQYTGAIHMLADPSGSRLAGKWLGHGKEGSVNTGPWRLDFQAPVSAASVAEYDRPPND
jgi:transcriptional regulator with XRE-family HTH domain